MYYIYISYVYIYILYVNVEGKVKYFGIFTRSMSAEAASTDTSPTWPRASDMACRTRQRQRRICWDPPARNRPLNQSEIGVSKISQQDAAPVR